MPHKIENNILVDCNNCIVYLEKMIDSKEHFKIKKFKETLKKSKMETLEAIIGILFYHNNFMDTPIKGREYITNKLIEQGQFKLNEIKKVFDEFSIETSYYTREFKANHPEVDFEKRFIMNIGKKSKKNDLPLEIQYNFPIYGCDFKILIGICQMDVEILKCQDCGQDVLNVPENVTIGYEHHLMCPHCLIRRKEDFDYQGLVREGNPTHHGNWRSSPPEFFYNETDYFGILHNRCKKSKRNDGKGFMVVNGVYVDDCGRVVLSLKCNDCGGFNAIKPFTIETSEGKKIPLLNESGAIWRRVQSRFWEIIFGGESHEIEFKSSLRWDYKKNKKNKELEFSVIKTIASFMNSDGGILLIGISDEGQILGLEPDYKTLSEKGNKNKFELQITNLTNHYIGKEFRRFFKFSIEEHDEKEICWIEVYNPGEPVFVKKKNKKYFFIRQGNRTEQLNDNEIEKYISFHFDI